ncbi:MAG: response regulator [Sphaerochaetaceae bacterium]
MRILIVEDDSIILKGLTKGINWKEEGISFVATATDGEMAVQQLRTNPVDIVLTDINMPFMSGLELTRHIKEQYPQTLVIIFTGYETFEYAKEAVKLGVFDYLMKPVHPKELLGCVHKAMETIQMKQSDQKRMYKSLALLRQDFFAKLFDHKLEEEEIQRQCLDLQLPYITKTCNAAIICLEDYENVDNPIADSEKTSYDLLEMTTQIIGTQGYVWSHNGKYLSLIAEDTLQKPLIEDLRTVLQRTNEELGASLVISLGERQDSLKTITIATGQALLMQNQFGILFHNRIIEYENLESLHSSGDIEEMEEKLYLSLYEGRYAECERLLHSIESDFPIERRNSIVMCLLFHIGNIVTKLVEQHALLENCMDFDSLIKQIVSIKQIPQQFEILRNTVEKICKELMNSANLDPLNLKMLSFVDTNFSNPLLSLTMLGDYLEMSPAYLCSMFKQKNQLSFSEYVTNLRMEKARILLCTTSKKNYEIASAVGISNAQYFCARFKRMYGLTPKEYKGNE